MESNYQNLYLSNWVTISVNSFTMKRKIIWFFTSRNSLQGFTTWSCANEFDLHRLVQVGSNNNFVTNLKLGFLDSFKTWLLRFFKVGVLDCLNFCRVSGLFLHLEIPQMSHLSSLFIELRKEEDLNSSLSLEFNLNWFGFDLI